MKKRNIRRDFLLSDVSTPDFSENKIQTVRYQTKTRKCRISLLSITQSAFESNDIHTTPVWSLKKHFQPRQTNRVNFVSLKT